MRFLALAVFPAVFDLLVDQGDLVAEGGEGNATQYASGRSKTPTTPTNPNTHSLAVHMRRRPLGRCWAPPSSHNTDGLTLPEMASKLTLFSAPTPRKKRTESVDNNNRSTTTTFKTVTAEVLLVARSRRG